MSVVVEAKLHPIAESRLPEADPCVVVIFGASGDLTQRKLVPALYHLACTDCLANQFKVLGVGRDQMSDDEFRALNDILMFERAGFSIAMGQADERVRHAAHVVTTANTEEGFAHGIEDYILNARLE